MPKTTLQSRKFFIWQVRVTEQCRDLIDQMMLKVTNEQGRVMSKAECFDQLISKMSQELMNSPADTSNDNTA